MSEWCEWCGFHVRRDGLVLGPSGRVVRGTRQSRGYLQTTTSGKKKNLMHHIVAGAWHGFNSSEGTEVDHIDGDKQNNTPDNLRVVVVDEHRRLDTQRRMASNGLPQPMKTPDLNLGETKPN